MIHAHVSRMGAPLALALLLAGCDALLGGGKHAQLYRFGAPPPPVVMTASVALPGTTRTLLLLPVHFSAEIDGDRILTVQGQQTAYIKGARWAAAAPALFAEEVSRSFATRAPALAVVDQRSGRAADVMLQIAIDRFEARYAGTAATVPIVVIEGRATLIDSTTRLPIGSFRLNASQSASAGNAAAVAAAFDQVTATTVAATIDWANTATLLKSRTALPASEQRAKK